MKKEVIILNLKVNLINNHIEPHALTDYIKIKLPKLGLVNIKGYRNLGVINGRIINATITRETTNKYYVSVLVDEIEVINKKIKATNIVGIDLGIKDLVITSDGEKYSNSKELQKREKQIKRLQRKLSRQIKGSNN